MLVTYLKVPSFIATLTMLFIGRGLVLGLTGGKTIAYEIKAREFAFFALGEGNALGFNNQILVFLLVAVVGGSCWRAPAGATRPTPSAATRWRPRYAGIDTAAVRIRGFVLAALCATLAGLMNVAQDKGVTSQYGLGAELIVIAAVIVGGASILGGRGRVLGSCLGAVLVVLIDKVLREGVPITRILKVGNQEMQVQAMASLPPGRGAGLPRPDPAGGGADRALDHPPQAVRPAAGPAARRRAAAAWTSARRHRGARTHGTNLAARPSSAPPACAGG